MKLNKMTLAAILTMGLLASTNAGFTQETATESSELLAACPLSGCNSPAASQTATCPKCHNDIDSCSCQPKTTCDPCKKEKKSCDSCKKISDDCNPCPPLAKCPQTSSPTCAVCPQPSDDKKFTQQVYAYPNAIYGDNQVVGERNNGLYLGDGSTTSAFSGIPVATGTSSSCGCQDGSMTGAAAAIPCLDNCIGPQGISVDRNPSNLDGSGCPVQIHTNTSMEAMKKSYEEFNYSPSTSFTGAAAPIANYYPDVPYGYWASCDINKLTTNDILAGYPNGNFKPNTAISRAEMATMVVKGFGLDSCSSSTHFSDVPSSHWASRSIASAVDNGMMAGYPNNTFKPNQSITRAEVYSILAKNINCPMDECRADEILSQYADGNTVPNWARVPVAKVLDKGGITDFPNPNHISPNKDASRAEVASMMENVRVSMGYSKDDTISAADCPCEPKKAYMENEEIVTIPTLQLSFRDEISAKSAHVGDRFSAKTIDAVTINGIQFPAGSDVYGKVLEVVRPTKNCQGALKLSFDRIQHDKCKADLPNQILTAQVNKVKKPNAFARIIEFPFTWTGGLLGNVGRTVGGAVVSLGNAVENTFNGFG
ncbi:S-layer homology domain-containing protein, partial [bacterium]|nr:S-layer homology domain-containing protein [bacterium]